MPYRPLSPLTRLALCAGALLLVPACRSAAEFREEADRQVYDILAERRAELGLAPGFAIDPPVNSLRQRLLNGESVAAEEMRSLSLADCLDVAGENSRVYQSRKEDVYLSALDLTLERHRFGYQPTGTVVGGVEGVGSAADFQSLGGDLGLTKLFGSGAEVIGGIGISLFRVVGSGDPWSAISDLGLAVTQPLLRGFGRDVVLEPLTQAERDVLYEVRSFERFRHTFAYDVTERYFRILQDGDELENARNNYQNLSRLRELNEALAEAGRLNDVQADQARQEELRARNSVIDAEQRLENSLDRFKLFLGLPIETVFSVDEAELAAVIETGLTSALPDEQEALMLALERRYDYATVRDELIDSERQLGVAADALRAGLDLRVAATAESEENRALDFRRDGLDWAADLTLDLPLDRLPERNAYRRALIDLESSRRGEHELADEIRSEVRVSLREMEATRESYRIQQRAVELAERRVESTALNFEAGRAETRDLLEAQEDLVEAQNAATAALIDSRLAELALYRDMEVLAVDESGLSLAPEVEELLRIDE